MQNGVAAGGADRGAGGLADPETLGWSTDHDVARFRVGEHKPHLLEPGEVPDIRGQGFPGVEATSNFLLEPGQGHQSQPTATGDVVVSGRNDLVEFLQPAGGVGDGNSSQQATGIDVDSGHLVGVGDRSAGSVDVFPRAAGLALDQLGQTFKVCLVATGNRLLRPGVCRVRVVQRRLPRCRGRVDGGWGGSGHGLDLHHGRCRRVDRSRWCGSSHHCQGTDHQGKAGGSDPHRGAMVGSATVEIGLSGVSG